MGRFTVHRPTLQGPDAGTVPGQHHYEGGTLLVGEDEADECCRAVAIPTEAGLLALPYTHVEAQHPDEFAEIDFPDWWLG